MKYDLASNVKEYVAFEPQVIGSDTTTAGEIIDTKDLLDLSFIMSATITDGGYTPLLQEGDAANLSDASAIADDNLIGTEAEAKLEGDGTTKVSKIGVVSLTKRYVRLSFVSANFAATGAVVSAAAFGRTKVQEAV